MPARTTSTTRFGSRRALCMQVVCTRAPASSTTQLSDSEQMSPSWNMSPHRTQPMQHQLQFPLFLAVFVKKKRSQCNAVLTGSVRIVILIFLNTPRTLRWLLDGSDGFEIPFLSFDEVPQRRKACEFDLAFVSLGCKSAKMTVEGNSEAVQRMSALSAERVCRPRRES